MPQADIAAELSAITGRTITHHAITPDELRQGALAAGMPSFVARLSYDFDLDASQGYQAIVTPTVEKLSGRAPTALRDFLHSQRDAILQLAK